MAAQLMTYDELAAAWGGQALQAEAEKTRTELAEWKARPWWRRALG